MIEKKEKNEASKKDFSICGICGAFVLASLNYCPVCNYGAAFAKIKETTNKNTELKNE